MVALVNLSTEPSTQSWEGLTRTVPGSLFHSLCTQLLSFSIWLISFSIMFGASLVAQLAKNPPAMQETLVQFLGWEVPLEKGYPLQYSWFSLVDQMVKNSPAMQETLV